MEKLSNQSGFREKAVPEYEFFKDPEERKEVFEYSKAIAEYLRSENIPNLVIIDRSSRPLYIGVREYLKAKYPDEDVANVYFMNPKGFNVREDLDPEEIDDIAIDCVLKDDLEEAPNQIRSRKNVMRDFKETYDRLLADKKKPVLIFDTCIHSGDTLTPVKNIFDKAGFTDARIGSVNPTEDDAKIKADFYITEDRPEKGCYPFDRDRMIEKTFDRVYSKPVDDPYKRERSVRLRREIKRIVTEYLIKEVFAE